MYKDKIEEMNDGKDKELLKLLNNDPKPFVRKHDGYAVKLEEETEITFKNHEDQETTIKIPAGDYIKVNGDSCYPEIETAESFEGKNKFIGSEEKSKMDVKKSEGPKIGLELMTED